MELISYFIESVIYALVVLVVIFCAKQIADKRIAKLLDANTQIIESGNSALGFRRAGFYMAIGIAMLSTLYTTTETSLIKNIVLQLADGALVVLFLFCALFINDRFILKGISNDQAIKENNIAVGLVEFGGYIATGIIAYASFVGTGPWYSSVVFFLLGQMVLVLMMIVYCRFTSFDLLAQIKQGNLCAGLMLAGVFIAYSLILKGSIIGPFNGWIEDLTSFAISTVSGIVLLLLIANRVIEKLFLPSTTLEKEIVEDQDLSPIIITVSIKITLALIIGAVVI